MLNHIPAKSESFRPEMADKPLVPHLFAAGWPLKSADRRSVHRFSLCMALRCRPVGSGQKVDSRQSPDTTAPGESLKISSKDLLFRSSRVFRAGQVVEVFIDWPVLLENGVRLMLVVVGPVTKRVRGITVMHFDKYRFRTHGRSEFVPG